MIIIPCSKRTLLSTERLAALSMSYLPSIFAYRVYGYSLSLLLDRLFPLRLLRCKGLFQVSICPRRQYLFVGWRYTDTECDAMLLWDFLFFLIGCSESRTLFVAILVHIKQNIHMSNTH